MICIIKEYLMAVLSISKKHLEKDVFSMQSVREMILEKKGFLFGIDFRNWFIKYSYGSYTIS